VNSGFKFPEQTALAAQAEVMLKLGDDHETVLAFLRAGGLGKLDSMRVLANATGMSILKTKNIVQGSKAWR